MPRKAVSNLTPSDIRAAVGALRTSVRGLAKMLGLSYGTVGHYLTDRTRVPVYVADRLRALLLAHAGDLLTPEEKAALSTADMAARANAARNQSDLAAGVTTYTSGFPEGRLARRQKIDPAEARVFKPYRVRADKSPILMAALKHWGKVCHARLQFARSDAHRRDYRLELADIAAIVARIPVDVRKGEPRAFDITITETEWDTISRALRHYAPTVHPAGKLDGPAYAFYQHWRKHRFAGYPFVPDAVKADRDALVAKLSAK